MYRCVGTICLMSDFPLTIALALAVIVPAVLVRAHAQVDGRLLSEWAAAHGVELTPKSRAMVARYLRVARVPGGCSPACSFPRSWSWR